MSNQELPEKEGLVTTQNGPQVETPTDETTREAVGATPVLSKRCDSESSEYFTKNPCFTTRSPLPKTERKSRGQPAKMTARRKNLVAILVALGFSLRQAARGLEIDHSTISKAAERDPDFATKLARAKVDRAAGPQLGFRGWRGALKVLEYVGYG